MFLIFRCYTVKILNFHEWKNSLDKSKIEHICRHLSSFRKTKHLRLRRYSAFKNNVPGQNWCHSELAAPQSKLNSKFSVLNVKRYRSRIFFVSSSCCFNQLSGIGPAQDFKFPIRNPQIFRRSINKSMWQKLQAQ